VISITRKVLLTALVAVAAAGLMASTASAKSYRVNLSFAGGQVGTALHATIKGAPLGTCHMKGTLVIPKTIQVWTCKGGTIKITGTGTTGAANNAKGTWKITGGTGKFKKIKGGGTFAGLFSSGKFKYKGTMSF